MTRKPPRGLFITGTDTGVGKTYVAALIARQCVAAGIRVGVYKPAASGCRREGRTLISDDAVELWEAAGRPGKLADVCPQRFAAPLAPHLAARAEKKRVDAKLLRSGLAKWMGYDLVLVEGAGGLMSPISDEDFVADLAADFGYPLVVVSLNRLGTINATLQTLITAAAFREGLPIAGVVLNHLPADESDPSRSSNITEIERLARPPVLALVGDAATGFDRPVDWLALAERGTA